MLGVVPTARDTFYDLSLTAAGMAAVGADDSWLPSPSAYGSATNANIFLVDGVNTTNPRGASWGSLVQVNYDTVQEVKVLSLGSRAEYGSFSGAAIDVLTKSGGNQFSGTVDVRYRDNGFQESGERLVGQMAKRQAVTNPTNTVFSIKRFMGRRHNEVGEEEKMVPYEIIGGADELVKVNIRGKEFTPPEISAMILRNLREAAAWIITEKG